jgi:hypothetical protein
VQNFNLQTCTIALFEIYRNGLLLQYCNKKKDKIITICKLIFFTLVLLPFLIRINSITHIMPCSYIPYIACITTYVSRWVSLAHAHISCVSPLTPQARVKLGITRGVTPGVTPSVLLCYPLVVYLHGVVVSRSIGVGVGLLYYYYCKPSHLLHYTLRLAHRYHVTDVIMQDCT